VVSLIYDNAAYRTLYTANLELTKVAFKEDASDIIVLLEEAKRKNKFVIHYGI
jgi:hypothetical protein